MIRFFDDRSKVLVSRACNPYPRARILRCLPSIAPTRGCGSNRAIRQVEGGRRELSGVHWSRFETATPSPHSRQTYASMVLHPRNILSAPQWGQVAQETPSDPTIARSADATSAAGTVPTTAEHSLQTRSVSSPRATGIRQPQQSLSPQIACGTIGRSYFPIVVWSFNLPYQCASLTAA
jgi:hypothetical protein